MFKIIEKNAVLGELLYRGFVWEKGRCRSSGLWKYTYTKSLKKHINLLNEIAMCMQKEFAKEEDNAFLRKIFEEFQCDNVLRRAYRNMTVDELKMKNFVITDCNDENRHTKILALILKLLEEVSLELDKGLKKDKRKICDLLFSLHNLPRVYLSRGVSTLFELRGAGIGENDALQYSKGWMNEEMLCIYEDYL